MERHLAACGQVERQGGAHEVADAVDIYQRLAGSSLLYCACKLAYHAYIEYYLAMAITKSAKKAHRQSLRKQAFNDARRSALRKALKAVRTEKSPETLSKAYQAIDKAYKRGLMKKNTAARRKASVAKLLKAKA